MHAEKKELINEFDTKYGSYKQKVPMLIPKLRELMINQRKAKLGP